MLEFDIGDEVWVSDHRSKMVFVTTPRDFEAAAKKLKERMGPPMVELFYDDDGARLIVNEHARWDIVASAVYANSPGDAVLARIFLESE